MQFRNASAVATAGLALIACGPGGGDKALEPSSGSAGSGVAELAAARGLSEADVAAALKTYVPSGKKDDYYIFSSGGQSGQVLVLGIPSMRLLKVIAVFTPEPWQGWGTGDDESERVLAEGDRRGMRQCWGEPRRRHAVRPRGAPTGDRATGDHRANGRYCNGHHRSRCPGR